MKTCKRCGGSYEESFFHLTNTRVCKTYRQAVCVGCRQQGRDTEKGQNRFRFKARNVVRTHAARLRIQKVVLVNRLGCVWSLSYRHQARLSGPAAS